MKQAAIVVVAVLAVVGAVVFGISRLADVSSLDEPKVDKATTEKERTEAWEQEAVGAFGGRDLSRGVIDMVEGARQWHAGTRPTEQFKTELDRRRNQFLDVQTRLKDLRDFPYDKRVNGLYQDAADLYLQTVLVYQRMVDTPAGDVRTQLDLLARRVRILGDRVFDRGRELVKPTLHEAANPDVDIRLPDEVPNWVDEGIAPGPPLEATPPPAPSGKPTLREPTRPQQPRADWLQAVQALGLTAASDARALTDAAERLRATPDPQDDREEGTRIRLSLVVGAEAARARQLELPAVARQLAVVAEHLWDGPGLFPR